MNMLYRNIHYSDNKKVFSTGDSMTLPVVYHNLKVELSFIEKKMIPRDEIKYHSLIDSVKKNLESIKVEDDYAKEIKKKCDDDLFEAFKNIQSCYPNLHLQMNTDILKDMKKKVEVIRPNYDIESDNSVIEMYGPNDEYLGYTQSEIVFLDWLYRVLLDKNHQDYYFIITTDGNKIQVDDKLLSELNFKHNANELKEKIKYINTISQYIKKSR